MAKNMKNAAELFAENVEIIGVDEMPENEEIVDEIADEAKGQYIPMEDDKGEIKDIFPTRGFKSLKDAKEWTKSPNFTNLGKADQAEFLDWLNNIK